MTTCDDLAPMASAGAAPALRAVDCLANQAAASGFGRLFGPEGALLPALTIILTLYIAFFAISLLTGRSQLGVSALTPRMMTLGLVLTFATSWVAYQGVVWNLAVGAPDELASILTGSQGSATLLFADKLDIVFGAVAQAASAATQGAQGAASGSGGAGATIFTPANLMWLAALILLLGTLGVLVTARIALAMLLAIGPVFVVFALFQGTRGLFVGWLRGVVMTGITPLFVVLGGGLMLELMVPVIASLSDGITVNGQAAIALFLIACVHMALMVMILKVTGSLVAGWQVFGLAGGPASVSSPAGQSHQQGNAALQPVTSATSSTNASGRGRHAAMAASLAPPVSAETGPPPTVRENRKVVVATDVDNRVSPPPLPAQRARGVGSRFRPRPSQFREMKA